MLCNFQLQVGLTTLVTGRDWIRLACVVTGAVMVMKSCAENHYFQVSGKKRIPSTSDVSFCFLYYLFHVLPRKVLTQRFVKVFLRHQNYNSELNVENWVA